MQQIQYNTHNVSSAANYNSTSTSMIDSFIEILKNSTIIIGKEDFQENVSSKTVDKKRE